MRIQPCVGYCLHMCVWMKSGMTNTSSLLLYLVFSITAQWIFLCCWWAWKCGQTRTSSLSAMMRGEPSTTSLNGARTTSSKGSPTTTRNLSRECDWLLHGWHVDASAGAIVTSAEVCLTLCFLFFVVFSPQWHWFCRWNCWLGNQICHVLWEICWS